MKKLTKLSIAAILCMSASLVSADDNSMSNVYFGGSSVSIDGLSTTNCIAFGADLMTSPNEERPISIGLGFNLDSFTVTGSTNTDYNSGLQLKIGYNTINLIHYPIKLKAGVGYSVTRVETTNYSGLQYSAAAEAKVYKSLDVGVKYTGFNIDNATGSSSVSFYVAYSR